MIQRRWRWTRKRIVIQATSEELLQEKSREVRRRLVAHVPVGASAKKKTERLKEMQSTLKAVKSGESSWTRSWRTWNLTSASALEEWNGDLWWWWSRPEQYADIAGGEHVGKFRYARDNETDLVRPFRSHTLRPCCLTQSWRTWYQSEPDHTLLHSRWKRVARLRHRFLYSGASEYDCRQRQRYASSSELGNSVSK